jgi:hypothetical protein
MKYDNTILAGYLGEDELAALRELRKRTLRLERQRGDGPPFSKIGNRILYPADAFRAWIKSRESQPVRSGR